MGYACSLSPELQLYALENLNEDVVTRDRELISLQLWLSTKPYLHAHQDASTLIIFLRGCKFDQDRARRKIVHYYEMRSMAPEWFANRDPDLIHLRQLLKLGVFIPLLQRESPTKPLVIIVRAAVHNTKTTTLNDVFKVSKMVMEMVLHTDELVSISGVHAVIDLQGVTLGHVLQLNPGVIKKLMHAWQDCYPIRTRKIDFINCPPHVNLVLNIFRRFMTEKMRQRTGLHSRDSRILVTLVDPKIVPLEYGGKGKKLDDIIAHWMSETVLRRAWYLEDEVYKADLSAKV